MLRNLGLRVPLTPEAVSDIIPIIAAAAELTKVDIFLMDQDSMLPKYRLTNMDQMLRAIENKILPFKLKNVVLVQASESTFLSSLESTRLSYGTCASQKATSGAFLKPFY